MVKARQFKELEVDTAGVDIEPLEQVDHLPRQLQAPEMTEGAELTRALEDKDEG